MTDRADQPTSTDATPPVARPHSTVTAELATTVGPAPEHAAAPAPVDDGARPIEHGGPAGPEPTRYGDWERKGRCIDF